MPVPLLVLASWRIKALIFQVAEREEFLELSALQLPLQQDYSFFFAFLFPFAPSSASFPIPSDVFRIDSLL